MIMFRLLFSFVIGVIFLFSADAAHAALSEDQIQAVLGLLQSFQVEGSVIASVENSLRGIPNTCPVLTRSMSLGSSDVTTDGQVSEVQRFLYVRPITGSFDTITEQAVRAFQREFGVVSSGTPDTTGYGVVGPRTRAKIAEVCAARQPQSTVTTTGNSTQSTTPTPSVSIPTVTPPLVFDNSGSLDSFRETVQVVGEQNGLSESELETVDSLVAENATSTSFQGATEEESSGFSNSLLGSLAGTLANIIAAGTGPDAPAPSPTFGTPFGTPNVLSYMYCGCSQNLLIKMQPVGPYNVVLLTYRPGTQKYESFNIPTVGQSLVGYYQTGDVCLIPTGNSCSSVPSQGFITAIVGSSLQ